MSSAEITSHRKALRRVRNPEWVEFLDVAGGVLDSWEGVERMHRLQAVRVINSAVPPVGPLADLPELVWLEVDNFSIGCAGIKTA